MSFLLSSVSSSVVTDTVDSWEIYDLTAGVVHGSPSGTLTFTDVTSNIVHGSPTNTLTITDLTAAIIL